MIASRKANLSMLVAVYAVLAESRRSNAFVTPLPGTKKEPLAFVCPSKHQPARLPHRWSDGGLYSTELDNAVAADVEGGEEGPAVVAEEEPSDAVDEEASPAEGEEAADAEVAAEAVAALDEEPAEEAAPAPEPEDGTTCYVGNISQETTEVELRELFRPFGEVVKVAVPLDRYDGKPRGFGFVTMETKEQMETAMAELDGSEVNGVTLAVKESTPRGQQRPRQNFDEDQGTKIYIGNVRYETTPADLEELFSPFGEVSNVFIPTDRETGEPRGFAFLSMADDDALRAIEAMDGTEFQGRILTVNKSLPRGTKAPRRNPTPANFENETKIYVGNMNFETEGGTLRDLFEEYGYVRDVYVPINRDTGRARGFAFVSMEKEAARRAIEEVNGCELDGRIIRVNEAEPRFD